MKIKKTTKPRSETIVKFALFIIGEILMPITDQLMIHNFRTASLRALLMLASIALVGILVQPSVYLFAVMVSFAFLLWFVRISDGQHRLLRKICWAAGEAALCPLLPFALTAAWLRAEEGF
jgi:hypothetical protein